MANSAPESNVEPAAPVERGSSRRPGSAAVAPDQDAGQSRRAARGMARTLLLAATAVAILWQGATSPQAVAVVALLVGGAWAASWWASPRRKSAIEAPWLWFGLAAWTALLILPLPRAVVQLVHPLAVTISDAGRAAMGAAPRAWLPIALAPGDAALQAVIYALAGVVGTLASNACHGAHSRRFTQLAATTAIGAALAASVFRYAVVELVPSGALPSALGPLLKHVAIVNPNHMAGILAFAFALALGLAVHAPITIMQTGYGAAALLTGTMVLLTGSRGGMLAVAIAVLGVLVSTPRPPKYMRTDRRELQNQARWRASLLTVVLALLAAITALPIIEAEFHTTDLAVDGKVRLVAELPKLILQAPLIGWGPGSLPVVLWMRGLGDARQDFAENMVVERLLDQGLIGGTLFLLALAWIAARYHRMTPRVYAIKPFVIAPAVLLAANLVDFSMEIAGGLLPFALVCALVEQSYVRSAKAHESLQHRRTASHRRLMIGTGAALLFAGALGLSRVPGHLTRDTDRLLTGKTASDIKDIVANRLVYHPYAFYLAGRALVNETRLAEASAALDRAIALRPASKHARLFRFASRLELGNVTGAADDLQWLMEASQETRHQALGVCQHSKRAEELLVEVMHRVPKLSSELGAYFATTRPDLVERVAVALRKRYPNQRFGIEAQRALLYIDRGALEPAKRIAAELMADPGTVLDGYYIEGRLRWRGGRHLEAFHLFKTVCEGGGTEEACTYAVESIMAAQRPAMALEFIRSRWHALRSYPPAAAKYYSWVARAQIQLDRWDEALDAARMAYNLDPKNPNGPYVLATCLEHASLFGELAELAEHLVVNRPGDPAALQLLERVRELQTPLSFAGRRQPPRPAQLPSAPTPPALAAPPTLPSAAAPAPAPAPSQPRR